PHEASVNGTFCPTSTEPESSRTRLETVLPTRNRSDLQARSAFGWSLQQPAGMNSDLGRRERRRPVIPEGVLLRNRPLLCRGQLLMEGIEDCFWGSAVGLVQPFFGLKPCVKE